MSDSSTTAGPSDAAMCGPAIKPPKKRKLKSDVQAFDRFWEAYPKRLGDNPKRRALNAWNARICEGVDSEAMISGAERYAAFIRANGTEGTPYVKQAATFLGPDRAFEHDWSEPEQSEKSNRKLRPGDPHPTDPSLVVAAIVDGEPLFEPASERRRRAMERLRATDY